MDGASGESTATRRVALVTGAGQGIGRALALDLAAHGWDVAATDLEGMLPRLGQLPGLVGAGAGRIVPIALDVTDESSVSAAVAAAVEALGGLDLLVNNAGISRARTAPLASLDRATWDLYLAVNLTGPMLCAKHASPHLAARRGAIINISSVRASRADPDNECYTASKAGLVGLTKALAVSLGPAIRVNAICPGWINGSAYTGDGKFREYDPSHHAFHPAGRIGDPADIAAWVRFLASPESAFTTGQAFVVDGGVDVKLVYR